MIEGDAPLAILVFGLAGACLGFLPYNLTSPARRLARPLRLPRRPRGRRLRLFLSEFTLPTDHENFEFNLWVTQDIQARWLGAALRIARRWERIYTPGLPWVVR